MMSMLSRCIFLLEYEYLVSSFPTQQLDLRKTNSWVMKLEEIQTPELAEVFAINAMAPFILNGRLKAFMASSPSQVS